MKTAVGHIFQDVGPIPNCPVAPSTVRKVRHIQGRLNQVERRRVGGVTTGSATGERHSTVKKINHCWAKPIAPRAFFVHLGQNIKVAIFILIGETCWSCTQKRALWRNGATPVKSDITISKLSIFFEGGPKIWCDFEQVQAPKFAIYCDNNDKK